MTKFIPKNGQRTWYVCPDRVDLSDIFAVEVKHVNEWSIEANTFRTKKEATEALKKIKLILKNN